MEGIRTIKLEILRQGPAHNQLLSPLTPYIALCGSDGPVPVKIPFEHQQLLNRLERLRYVSSNGAIPASQREAEVRELGVILGEVLGQVPGLLATICDSSQGHRSLNHLRLTLSANEMSLVPFELAIGANGFPASGSPLLLQSQGPICLTREVRRSQPLPVNWDRPVRILYAFASPPNLAPVPAQDHLEALRRAIDPFVAWSEKPEERIKAVKNVLTVLPDASLEDIREACEKVEYSHVHILAHGAPTEEGIDHHYGLALRDSSGAKPYKVANGERLAMALTSADHRVAAHRVPTCVTLATCDSATVRTVIAPSGSIAHALHAGGIPWVVASQFPLWMHASTIAAEQLYRGLLNGDDPRWLLHLLRQRLYTDSPDTHDWGSIVAYAIAPADFEQQLEQFHNRQRHKSLDMMFHKMEQLATDRADGEVKKLYDAIRSKLEDWLGELPNNPSPQEVAKCLAMCGASEKRIGIHCATNNRKLEAIHAYERAARYYRRAAEATPDNHWAITQYLSLSAVLNLQRNPSWRPGESLLEWWTVARRITALQLDPSQASIGEDRAWTLGTMVELELLGSVYGSTPTDVDRMIEWCHELVEIVGGDSFPARSTLRQFQRYRDFWPQNIWQRQAEQAIAALMAP